MNKQPNFHDGFVDGLLTSKAAARVFLRTVAGERFTLLFHDVDALYVTNLRQGNIILSLDFLEPGDLETADIREIYQYSDQQMKTFVLNDWVREARRRGLKIVGISPSYGCSLFAICMGHEFIDGYIVECAEETPASV